MSYTKTNWVNGTTPANETNMNKIEDELETLDTTTTELDTEINTINDKIAGTVLYENETGTTGNIVLSNDISNYKRIKMYGYVVYSVSNVKSNFGKEYLINSGVTNYTLTETCYNGQAHTLIVCQLNIISGTNLTRGTCILLQIGETPRRTTDGVAYITKIVGFED